MTSTEANPNISGKDSTASLGSTGSEDSSSSSEEGDFGLEIINHDQCCMDKDDNAGEKMVSLKV